MSQFDSKEVVDRGITWQCIPLEAGWWLAETPGNGAGVLQRLCEPSFEGLLLAMHSSDVDNPRIDAVAFARIA